MYTYAQSIGADHHQLCDKQWQFPRRTSIVVEKYTSEFYPPICTMAHGWPRVDLDSALMHWTPAHSAGSASRVSGGWHNRGCHCARTLVMMYGRTWSVITGHFTKLDWSTSMESHWCHNAWQRVGWSGSQHYTEILTFRSYRDWGCRQ